MGTCSPAHLHTHDGGRAHSGPETCPDAHVTVSPGRQVIAQDAQLPSAGALHDGPVSAFDFSLSFLVLCGFLWVVSSDGAGLLKTSSAANTATSKDRMMCPPEFETNLLRYLPLTRFSMFRAMTSC
jgi:hypothetical protein